jgi:hypothetical protein
MNDNDYILGYTWGEIKAGQRGEPVRKPLTPKPPKPATEKDREYLRTLGVEGLKRKRFHGVLDRLRNSGLID